MESGDGFGAGAGRIPCWLRVVSVIHLFFSVVLYVHGDSTTEGADGSRNARGWETEMALGQGPAESRVGSVWCP